jgi:hypothetical protein
MRALASRAARSQLAKMGARLDRERFEDVTSDLVVAGVEALKKFNPEVGQSRAPTASAS